MFKFKVDRVKPQIDVENRDVIWILMAVVKFLLDSPTLNMVEKPLVFGLVVLISLEHNKHHFFALDVTQEWGQNSIKVG